MKEGRSPDSDSVPDCIALVIKGILPDNVTDVTVRVITQ